MRKLVQTLALFIAVTGLIVWLLGGARLGFFVVTEEIPKIDPVTEIEYTERQDKFLPGIDFLAGGFILGGSFYLLSFLFPNPTQKKSVNRS